MYAGTGVADGDVVHGIVGYETDRFQAEYPAPPTVDDSRALLSESPIVNFGGTPTVSNASIYRAPSGAWVFAAGLGLDDCLGSHAADGRIARTTANVLAAFTAPGS